MQLASGNGLRKKLDAKETETPRTHRRPLLEMPSRHDVEARRRQESNGFQSRCGQGGCSQGPAGQSPRHPCWYDQCGGCHTSQPGHCNDRWEAAVEPFATAFESERTERASMDDEARTLCPPVLSCLVMSCLVSSGLVLVRCRTRGPVVVPLVLLWALWVRRVWWARRGSGESGGPGKSMIGPVLGGWACPSADLKGSEWVWRVW